MDLSNFRGSAKPDIGNKAALVVVNLIRIVDWILPPTADKRKERFNQYKDFALFIGVAATISYFQDNISKFLEIDTEAAKNMI
jgi:hypothetical protein